MHSEKDIKKICFITPGHISTNPRLVKEATALLKHNFKVHIIFTQYTLKQISEDYIILNANPEITYDVLNWSGDTLKSFILKIITGIKQKASFKIVNLLSFQFLKNITLNRNYNWQLNMAKKRIADLYIAHNLSALPIAIIAAKYHTKKAGFDAEDFHRFEISNDKAHKSVAINIFYEEKYMPLADYLTTASPLIAEAYEKILNRKLSVILNVFPVLGSLSKKSSIGIKLFWFSQTIGPNRGIETIVKAISILNNPGIELHLLGELSSEYKDALFEILRKYNVNQEQIKFYSSISPNSIPAFSKQFDIGLASETSFSINNKLALSNKIFTYCQTGLAIVASDTEAQQKLLNDNPGLGLLYQQNDASSLASILHRLCTNTLDLEEAKIRSFNYAKTKFNWELEQKKFISLVDGLWVK